MGQPFQGDANGDVGVCFQAGQRLFSDRIPVRLLRDKRKRCDGNDDRPRPAGLSGEFSRCPAARSTTKSSKEDHQFGAFQDGACHGVKSTHALFCKSRQRSTTLSLEGVTQTKHVTFCSDAQASVVGVNREQSGAWAAAVGRSGPCTTEAPDPGDDDLTAVHATR